jgi:hypothetical protein
MSKRTARDERYYELVLGKRNWRIVVGGLLPRAVPCLVCLPYGSTLRSEPGVSSASIDLVRRNLSLLPSPRRHFIDRLPNRREDPPYEPSKPRKIKGFSSKMHRLAWRLNRPTYRPNRTFRTQRTQCRTKPIALPSGKKLTESRVSDRYERSGSKTPHFSGGGSGRNIHANGTNPTDANARSTDSSSTTPGGLAQRRPANDFGT